MAELWRLFIAIELPPTIVTHLAQIQSQIKQQTPSQTVRWVEPRSIHLTLKFLGDVPTDQISDIQKSLVEAVKGYQSFELAAEGVGCFPNSKRPRVLWVGIRNQSDLLSRLHDSVEQHIAPLGYPTENRPFSPHLTLGRVRQEAKPQDTAQLGVSLNKIRTNPHAWQVTTVSLMRSELEPAGAIYTEIYHAALD